MLDDVQLFHQESEWNSRRRRRRWRRRQRGEEIEISPKGEWIVENFFFFLFFSFSFAIPGSIGHQITNELNSIKAIKSSNVT